MTNLVNFTMQEMLPKPGEVAYLRWALFSHPTGHEEFIPVVVMQGKADGPCIWLTAGIHGVEHPGPMVLYRLLENIRPEDLHGTIIALPALNPPGLRTMQREPYGIEKDPNRLWPEPRPPKVLDIEDEPPSALETAYRKLFDEMLKIGDALIDYHAAWTGSISFAFQDRIPYRLDDHAEENRKKAEELSVKQAELLEAYGHTVIREMSVRKLIEEDLHRSTSAAFMYIAQKPAFTVELGTGHMPDPNIIAASVEGTKNVLKRLGMLEGDIQPIRGIKVIRPEYSVKRCMHPRVRTSCVVLHNVEAGDWVKQGQVVAEMRDIWGRLLPEGLLTSEVEGFVVGRAHGIYYYPGDAVLCMAIRDESPLVEPFPESYFKSETEHA